MQADPPPTKSDPPSDVVVDQAQDQAAAQAAAELVPIAKVHWLFLLWVPASFWRH